MISTVNLPVPGIGRNRRRCVVAARMAKGIQNGSQGGNRLPVQVAIPAQT